jgi:hypothetical protein
MTKEELIEKLKELHGSTDPEMSHSCADDLLLDYIGDEDVDAAYRAVPAWYA